jgi:hypothetical protein
MVASFEVMNEISRYLRQDVSYKLFRSWMVDAIMRAENKSEEIAMRLLSEIDGLSAQFSDGYLAEESLRKELAKLLLSNSSQDQFVSVQYSFLRPSFVTPLPSKIKSSETSSTETALSDNPHVTQELAVA